MRKFILLSMACLTCLLMFTSCKTKVPEFKMDLQGVVTENTTQITTTFTVGAANVTPNYFDVYDATYPVLTKESYPDAYKWLTDKVLGNVPNDALYDISASGFIEWNGLKLSFNEHWQKPEAVNHKIASNY